MESMQELIPFAREMLSQRPGRALLKVYLLGSVFAVLGTIIGLAETVCRPLSSGQPMDAEDVLMLAREERRNIWSQEEEEEEEEEEELTPKNGATTQGETLTKTHTLGHRSTANRLHAS
ncbi:G0/G1 switch protein 2 [Scophthalmus maximus]|uniref:G0/G1 switch protein 2 n=1 Tax=Scophthalmus maximus TaxID=52904 RepID=UPI001FA89A88|nr:G0/G1 switch protein 2 [Scophthalmus maximus]XP_035488795.2 G0/G1 switch protein 2 [Scophthalmus maximus]